MTFPEKRSRVRELMSAVLVARTRTSPTYSDIGFASVQECQKAQPRGQNKQPNIKGSLQEAYPTKGRAIFCRDICCKLTRDVKEPPAIALNAALMKVVQFFSSSPQSHSNSLVCVWS